MGENQKVVEPIEPVKVEAEVVETTNEKKVIDGSFF